MLKLFQSIFGGGEARGEYPESLIEAAIERAVDGTDPRLRHLPRYQKLLRASVIHAMDHVIALVDDLPAPQPADRTDYDGDLRLRTLFTSAKRMSELFANDMAMRKYRAGSSEGGGKVTALLLAERIEKHVMGMELNGEMLRRDVAQTVMDFRGHRLVDPAVSEDETRRQLKRRAFDHLLSLALQRIAEVESERAGLGHQRALLQRKLAALQQGGWGFDAMDTAPPQPAALQAELAETERQLAAIGAAENTLHAHLDITANLLMEAERQLWGEALELRLDRMNVQREAQDAEARLIGLQELHNARDRRMVTLLIVLNPDELPQPDDFLTAAQRLLG